MLPCQGGFPRSYLATSDADSLAWCANAIASHVEVELPQFGVNIAAPAMARQLQPWHQNLGKRQVNAPKIYFHDTGLLHALMGVSDLSNLLAHPRCGASWKGFALEQVLRLAKPDQAYFWGTYQGAELDRLMLNGAQRIGVEFKRADVP